MKNENLPIFTTANIFPTELNLSIGELQDMPDVDFRKYCEKLRHNFIDLHQGKFPVFSTSRSIDDIKINMKRFASYRICDIDEITNRHGKRTNILIPIEGMADDANPSRMLSYSTINTNVVNHWFPEIWDTKISTGFSVTDQFYDEETFYRNVHAVVIKNRFKVYTRNDRIGDSLIQCLRIVNGNQPVYNFPSTLASWIYINKAKTTPTNGDFSILDMSCGWAGRLLGALASIDNIKSLGFTGKVRYYGTDVNLSVHDRFDKIVSFWNENIIDSKNTFDFYKSTLPAEILLDDEVFFKNKNSFDIMFTSPPYFNKEMYSDHNNQSYIKYNNNYNSWRDGFLEKMLYNTYELLKEDGEAWINIADVKYKGSKYHPLERDTVELAQKVGFKYIDKYYMIFGIMPGLDKQSKMSKLKESLDDELLTENIIKNKNTKDGNNPITQNTLEYNGKKFKYEPIFVLRK